MSGFESIVPMAIGAVSAVGGAVGQDRAADAAAKAQSEAVDRQNQAIAQQQAAEEKRRRDLLEKASATQRARMAASGMGGGGGSADAILAGMSQETAESIADSAQLAQNRLKSYRGGGGASSNLLDTAASQGLSVFRSFYGGID